MNWLLLFKEIITVWSENNRKLINTKEALLNVRADGTYSFHLALMD
jgi:hypothetical protein